MADDEVEYPDDHEQESGDEEPRSPNQQGSSGPASTSAPGVNGKLSSRVPSVFQQYADDKGMLPTSSLENLLHDLDLNNSRDTYRPVLSSVAGNASRINLDQT